MKRGNHQSVKGVPPPPYWNHWIRSRVDVALDWSVEPLLLGGFCWRALRPGQCDLVVELKSAAGAWEVETSTEKKGEPRRCKGKKENWRSGLSLDDAYVHLEDVFDRLRG